MYTLNREHPAVLAAIEADTCRNCGNARRPDKDDELCIDCSHCSGCGHSPHCVTRAPVEKEAGE